MTLDGAAYGVYAIVNENMAAAAKAYVSEQGVNSRSCALVAFGGAGPVHACDLAARLGIETVLIPPRAGVAAAFGMIVAPVTYDAVRSRRMLYRDLTPSILDTVLEDMKAECVSRLPKTVALGQMRFEASADVRYLGQGYDVSSTIPEGVHGAAAIAAIREAFERAYTRLYGRIYKDLQLEIMNFRLSASASRRVGDAPAATAQARGHGRVGARRAFCPREKAWKEFAVYRRDQIGAGGELAGPAIVEEDESTTIVPSAAKARVDEHGSLIVTLAKAATN
jgi:N-methylhydantoinase A